MITFNPSKQITLTPDSNQKLVGEFNISNHTKNCSVPFKIKSTKPQIFIVQPYMGVLAPLQQAKVVITTTLKNSPDFARQLAHSHKFQIQYAMLSSPPNQQGDILRSVPAQQKQTHKLCISTVGGSSRDSLQVSSTQQYQYRTAHGQPSSPQRSSHYQNMNHDEQFQYLNRQIPELQKQKSELMNRTNKKGVNLLLCVGLLVIGILLGNLMGKGIGLGRSKKERQYGYFGLERMWTGKQSKQGSWWQFWK